MKNPILMALALMLVACASTAPRQVQSPLATSGAAFAPGAAAPAAEVVTLPVEEVDVEEIDNGLVCEKRQRPGSKMTQTFCYTREEHLAREAARDEALRDQLDELQREARWRDEIIRQAELERRRPSGFGIGPN